MRNFIEYQIADAATEHATCFKVPDGYTLKQAWKDGYNKALEDVALNSEKVSYDDWIEILETIGENYKKK